MERHKMYDGWKVIVARKRSHDRLEREKFIVGYRVMHCRGKYFCKGKNER